MQRHRPTGATAFDVDHRHTLRKKMLANKRSKAYLPANISLTEGTHPAIAEPGILDRAAIV
jgi:hypothetical protein